MPDAKYFKHFKLKDGREFIVHTSNPAFLAAVVPRGGMVEIEPVFWLAESTDAVKLAKLMRRMTDWYYYAVRSQENEPSRSRKDWRESRE